MKEFIKLDKYGQLYIDKILFESYFPIIFTCVNSNHEIFICVCCQSNEKGCKWLIGKTNGISIVRMLRDEITVRKLLLEHSTGKISVDYVNSQYTVSYNNSDWANDSEYLPKEDSYMYADIGEFDDEISYFSSFEHICYDSKNYKNIMDVLGTVKQEKSPITETDILAYAISNITIKFNATLSTSPELPIIKIELENNNLNAA
jgi:hypothetical protein